MTRPRRIARSPLGEPVAGRDGGAGPGWGRFFASVERNLVRVDYYDVALDPGSIGAGATAEVTASVAGLKPRSLVVVAKPSHTPGVGVVNARVSAADTLALTFMNASAAPVDPPSEVYRVLAIRV